jgi:exoribonuclease-2
LPIVTIDGPHTRDFDDAISVELNGEFLDVGIHIADVTAWIEPGSILDHAAAQRASSLYLPRQQIPMLPPDLSQDILSLKQGCDRPAISLLARLDKNGNLIDYRFVASLIRVQENLIYDAVNSGLGGRIAFSQIHRLCQKLREKRMERGALSLSLPEIEILVGADCSVSISLVPQDSPSRMIVAELMILYNWLAARFCNDHNIPLLYRTQAEPSERLKHDTDGYFYYVFTQRRKLNPLLIDISPKQHSGLGLEVYTHATSPIRRYLDLVTQRQLGGYLTGLGPVYGTSDLEALRIPIEPVLRDLARVKRNRIRYWVLKYLSQHQNEQFKALMLYELRNKYRILLTDSLIIGDIRKQMHRTLQPADEIMVEVKKADPLENRLELEYQDGSERRND